jgi:hypothetical protein
MNKSASPPAPSPLDPDWDVYTVKEDDPVILCVGALADKKLHPPFKPLPVGLRFPRVWIEKYRTTATSPEEYRDLCLAGEEGAGLGAVRLNQPLRWTGKNWRRARQLTPEQLRAEAASSLANEQAENEYRDRQRAEEDARLKEVISSARERHSAGIAREIAERQASAHIGDEEGATIQQALDEQSAELGLDGIEPEPLKRPRETTAFVRAKTGPPPPRPEAPTAKPQAVKKQPPPKQPSKPVKKKGK